MSKRYRPQLRWTTYAGQRRQMWAGYDSAGHVIGWYLDEETAWHAMGIVGHCACGATYTAQQWAELELVGVVDRLFQQRNCTCGSTISRETTERDNLTC